MKFKSLFKQSLKTQIKPPYNNSPIEFVFDVRTIDFLVKQTTYTCKMNYAVTTFYGINLDVKSLVI